MKHSLPLAFVFALSLSSSLAQINISGSADVKVVPDRINIRVGVETRDESLDEAQSKNDERMRSALQFLKAVGVGNKDLQTDYISVMPAYKNDSWSAKPELYIVRKSIEINLTNTANFETIMTGLLTNGVDHVDSVEFRTSQLRKYRDEARAKAIQAAKEKADALCAEVGVKRGKPLNISANDSGGFWNYAGAWNSQGYNYIGNAQVVAPDGDGDSDSAGDTVSLGQISVSATVNVSFALE